MSNRKSHARKRNDKPQAEAVTDEGRTDAEDSRSILEVGVDWLQSNILWVLGITPFALAALQILIVARGDPATLRVLVQNADPIRVILGSVLPIIPMTLLVLAPYYIERRIRKESVPSWWAWGSIAILALGLFALPSAWFSLLTYSYLMMIFVMYERWLRRKGKKSIRVYRPLAWFLPIVLVSSAITGPWMSAELVEVRNDAPVVAYVVDDREGWTTLLRYGGGVKIVRSSDVENRTACNVRVRGESVIGQLFKWPEGNALCEDLEREFAERRTITSTSTMTIGGGAVLPSTNKPR